MVMLGLRQVVRDLEVEPEPWVNLEEAPEANRCVRRDVAAPSHNVADPVAGDVYGLRQRVRGEAQRLHVFFDENFTRMCTHSRHERLSSMVVYNLNAIRTGFGPNETHAPPVVDADAELPGPIALQRFKPVARRRAQRVERRGRIQHIELASDDLGNGAPLRRTDALPEKC